MSVDKEIYLINNGLSCQEMYDKINQEYLAKKKKGLIISDNNKKEIRKLKLLKKNQLTLNGIIESRELKKNEAIGNLKNSNGVFYSICDRQSIETALITLNDSDPNFLFVLPYVKFCNDIKKPNDVTDFIKSFPSYNNRNNINKYWNINNNIISGNNNVNIDWSKVDSNSYSKIRNFDANKLINFIIEQRVNLPKSDHLTLFCNEFIMKKLLKLIKLSKQKPSNTLKMYNTQCIKLTLRENDNKFSFIKYDTIYPKELKPYPLIYKNNNFSYKFKGLEYKLNYKFFNKKSIYEEFKIIENCRCENENQIKKILDILFNKKNKKANTQDIFNNINNFNNIFNKLNKN